MSSATPWLLLTASTLTNLYLLLHARTPLPAAEPPVDNGRKLAEHSCSIGPSQQTMQDCASVACPSHFTPNPAIITGHSLYRPFLADTRWRPTPPDDMLELTRLLYGEGARLGEPFIGFDNPFDRRADLTYQWTQVNDRILDQAHALVGGRLRFVVEVGSFVGRSSVIIADWLRRTHEEGRSGKTVPLLCVDTWMGDVGMAVNGASGSNA